MLFSSDRTPKFAFVLGIGTYRHAPALVNPPHDVAAVAAELRRAGYDVEEYVDLDKKNIDYRLNAFVERAGSGGTMLVYYSGHGIQLADGARLVNYIVPADFSFDTEDPILGLVSVQAMIGQMAAADSKIIFLDACRDTAGLERTLKQRPMPAPAVEMGGSGLAQGATRGLGVPHRFRPLRRAPLAERTFMAFSSEAGDLAGDGTGSPLSPFTEAVVRYIGTRGLDVFSLSQMVAKDVRQATEGRQVPWTNSNLPAAFHIHARDPRPVWILGLLAALCGIISALLVFEITRIGSSGAVELRPPILIDVKANPWVLLSGIPMAIVLGIGAWRWGGRDRDVRLGIKTGLLYVVVAVLIRLWFASFATLDTLKPIYDDIGKGKLGWEQFFGVASAGAPIHGHPIWQVLVLVLVTTSAAGLATVLVGNVFNRSMVDLPRLAMGAVIGAGMAVLFVMFVIIQGVFFGVNNGLSPLLQISCIAIFAMLWEGLLGANAGWAYWWHVPLPGSRPPKRAAAKPPASVPSAASPPQAVDRFWEPMPQDASNRGTA